MCELFVLDTLCTVVSNIDSHHEYCWPKKHFVYEMVSH